MSLNWNIRYILSEGRFVNDTVEDDCIESYLSTIINEGVFEESIKVHPNISSHHTLGDNIISDMMFNKPILLKFYRNGLLLNKCTKDCDLKTTVD